MFGNATEVMYVIGQILGIIAVVIGFFTYQMKTAGKLLIFELIVSFLFSAHYLLIGATGAMALNFLCGVRCVFYYFRNKRGSQSKLLPIVFTVLIVATSILTWEGWYSVFIMAGLAVHSLATAMADAQKIRFAMFIKNPLCLAYNVMVLSIGGIAYECTVLVSSIIGVLRNRKQSKSR
ncbi:MAG: YgjV family protein [Clostridia bacterium]|nr:YgjV family protein [Clostridia bacterium]